jgi:hypothetical protein
MRTKVNTMIKLPETVTGKMYVVLTDDGRVLLSGSDFATIDGYTCLSEHELTVDVPQDDPTAKVVQALEDRAEVIQAEAAAAVREIMDKIQQLKCLEHKGES